ncbi:MAG: ABC transporter ATP-binding protein [Planctomycetes bacterium]|nr:ABC transporter ATP-binding protein [Planctomycetota bacterium]
MIGDFRRALAYLPRYAGRITLGMAAIPLAQAASLAIPVVIGRGLEELRQGRLSHSLGAYFAALLLLAAVRGVAKYTMRYFVVGASRRFEEDLRNDLYRHVLTLPPAWFHRARTGDLMSRLSWDVEAVRMVLGPGVMYMTETLFLLPALAILASFSWKLGLLALLPLGLIAWIMKRYAGTIHVESMKAQEQMGGLSNAAQESFAGIRVVKAFARERRACAQFERLSAGLQDQGILLATLRAHNWSLIMGANDLGTLVLLSAGCFELMRGAIALDQFVIFAFYLKMLFWPMIALGWMVSMYQRGRASMQRLNEVFDARPAIAPLPGAHRPTAVQGAIEFRGLTVAHGRREALKGIDLKIPAGAVIGVTGPTGSGKSTLAAVLPRLVEVGAGQAFLDGVDVTRWDVTALRRALGLVPQEAFLFADTVRANLALGRDDDDEAALRAALRHARVERELLDLPGGLDAVIGERGVTLSGGQRQRATIARALAADPRVLILDDCLSAVDSETEAEILAALKGALSGRTALLVSHRVAALQLADRVVVLEDGQIVEEGAPQELLLRRGRYHRLFLRQQAMKTLEST